LLKTAVLPDLLNLQQTYRVDDMDFLWDVSRTLVSLQRRLISRTFSGQSPKRRST
jgi:hypothetical protein